MEIAEVLKLAEKFSCEGCHYKCTKESDFKKHLLTQKHKSKNGNISAIAEMGFVAAPFKCSRCNKDYKTNSGLWKHGKKCKNEYIVTEPMAKEENPLELITNLVLEVVKQNNEFQKQMFEMCKNTQINNNHSHNKTFNMQVFLNEQCKDAMNIMDFVNTMTLELSDLEDVGEVGYVEGISKIIIRKLNELDVCKRPIHCSDFKREIMYVRDMDVWTKENNTFDKIRKAIKYVTKKNSDMLIPWIQKYPTGMNIEHPHNDIYMRLMNQAMGGRESFLESENKIIKKISKAVQIDKSYKC
jgi:hypothetical protein